MSINQLIAGGIQLPRFESPINMMAQLSQLEAAREANELRRMQMLKMQREQEQEMGLMNALQSGQPLSFQQAARGGRTGLSAFELQQGQLEAQRKRAEAQQLQRAMPFAVAARRAVNTPVESPEESDSLLMGARQELADLGISSPEIDQRFASLQLLGTPEARREGLVTLVSSIPGLEQTLAARQKEAAGIGKTEAETRKLNLEAGKVGMEMAGTLPRGEGQRLAPSVQVILDEEGKPIVVDITKFAGTARLGAPGVIGRPADMRRPAPTTASIQDPSDPSRQLIVDTREYTSGTVGSPGVIGVAGGQAVVSRGEAAKDRARADLSSSLETLESLYDTLDEMKGLPSTQRNAARNVAAYVASTTPGQIVGQAVGTEEQSIRDQISASRFILVQQIKNATGMSAQQMNSNFELQNALNSLSDPKVGIEAAKKIITNLRNQYVQGAKGTRGMAGDESKPDIKKVTGAPAGSSIGLKTSQGWEILKDGKVIGYAQE